MVEGLQAVIDFVQGIVNVPRMIAGFVSVMPVWFSLAIGLAVVFAFVAVIFKLISGG